MANPTDTNQASEDELKTKASDSSSEAGYTIIPELYEYCLGAGLELSNYQAIELTNLIQRLIRTEKLKLLAEIGEPKLGDVVLMQPEQYEGGVIIDEWYKNRINKLEAEL